MDRIRLHCLLFFGIISLPLTLAFEISCVNTCNCAMEFSKNIYLCGGAQSHVIINANEDSGVIILCNGFDNPFYLNALESVKIASNNSYRLYLGGCSVPDEPFSEIFEILNQNSTTELWICDSPQNAHSSYEPFHFENFGSLEVLYLDNNNIIQLPESIFKGVANLTKLSLSGNQLLHSLPANVFKPLTKLQALSLRSNNLAKLDNNVFRYLSNLNYLDLENNRLDDISKSAFASLGNLTTLYLANNHIQQLNSGIFDDLTQLMNLSLSHNKLSSLPDELFASNSQLRFVFLTSAFTSPLPEGLFAGLKLLQEVIMNSNHLKTLPNDLFEGCVNLRKVWLNDNSLHKLPITLFNDTKNIEMIDLSGNNLKSLDEAVFFDLRKLQRLYLARNHLKKIGRNLMADLISLSYLDLSKNELVDFEDETFAKLKKLTGINLSNNNLTMERWLIVSPLNKCTKLKWINLSVNSLTRVFEDWRNNMIQLESLDMTFNKLHSLTAPDFIFNSAYGSLNVNFSNNPIKTINLSNWANLVRSQCDSYPCWEDSFETHGSMKFNLEHIPINCDCSVFHWADHPQVLHKFVDVRVEWVNCKEWPDGLKNTPIEMLDTRELICPSSYLSDIDKKPQESCPGNCNSCYLVIFVAFFIFGFVVSFVGVLVAKKNKKKCPTTQLELLNQLDNETSGQKYF